MLDALIAEHKKILARMEVPIGLDGMRESALGLVRESAELLDCVLPGFRPWQAIDMEHADEEAIDVLCFLVGYFVARGWTEEDVFEGYAKVNQKISRRLDTKKKETV